VGKAQQFDVLRRFLTDASYADAAQELGMTEVAVRVAVHRLREKYRKHLRLQVAQTVDREEEVDEELRELLRAVG
jgi:RNA polymerase sigma-70 factor (ECF subfamily)